NNFTSNEDLTKQYNITINNTDGATGNITQVNITLSTSFVLTNGTDKTSIVNTSVDSLFSNNSATLQILRWQNVSSGLINSSMYANFSFNATASTPGNYTINVSTLNSTGVYNTSFNVYINDTTAPSSIQFVNAGLNGFNFTKNNSFGQIFNQTYMPINISVVDNGILRSINISIYNYTAGAVTPYTNYSSSLSTSFPNNATTFFVNFTGLRAGNYSINATTFDSFGNTNVSTTLNITINDTTAPSSVDFVSAGTGLITSANLSQNYIPINISAVDNGVIKTFNITLTNVSSGLALNTSNFTSNATTRFLNFTGLANGNYSVNATVHDNSGNTNTSSVLTFSLDTLAPSITHSCTPTTVNTGQTITCTCSATDATSGVNGSVAHTAKPTTNTDGSFTTTCTIGDNAGNIGSSSISYEVISSAAASGTGGGSNSITKTYIPTTNEIKSGYSQELKSNERVKLTVDSKTHYVAISSLTTTSATISVSSTPQTAVLDVGDEKNFDVNADGYYDLSVKLNSIANSKADVTIKSINVKVTEEVAPKTEETTTGEKITEGIKDIATGKGSTLWIIIAVIVILILIGVGYKYKKK
ncbi:MAG: hypothetical protein AABW67_03480, partial [Nanoarchaeota archaeon]